MNSLAKINELAFSRFYALFLRSLSLSLLLPFPRPAACDADFYKCFGKDGVCVHQDLLCDGSGDCLFEDDEMECGEPDSRAVNHSSVIGINDIFCIITYGR